MFIRLILLLSICVPLSAAGQTARLSKALKAYLRQLPDSTQVSIAVETLSGKTLFQYRAGLRTPAASVIKIPILVELMEQVKNGRFRLEDPYTVKAADKTGGSGVINQYPDNTVLPLRELARQMIVSSDNSATNILLRMLGMDAVNRRLDSLGCPKTRLNRIMMDAEAARKGRENLINTVEINTLLRKIAHNEVATPALCAEMMTFLKACEDRSTIPAKLPPGTVVAHKTGSLGYVRGDAAIVYARNPFVLSVFVQRFSGLAAAEQIIAEIGEICWRVLEGK